ncbi:hypothetical protein C8R45DRAFT_441657 [Mycena sanguinolenta]|nr:hypothetical protein C8R45DRAFT_441657 [Mycena sanguinolenta]
MILSNSRFASRLNTNYVPSDSEILEIRALLVGPTEEIARMDAQIAEMELSLVQLKEKRALLQEPVDAHRALISPMRLVPQDILLEIFFSCLPSQHNALIDHNEAPLLLGRICRYWRSVAYSSPILWSSIHIPSLDYLSTSPNILLGLERSVERWLERSATCPLSVSLYDYTNSNSNLEPYPLILQLVAVSRRLRSLALTGDPELLSPLLRLGPEELPVLKRVLIKTIRDDTPSMAILQIPSLEDITLVTSTPDDPLSLPLPWSQLGTLRLECHGRWTDQGPEGGLDLDGAFNVLRRCPSLKHCEIRVTKHSDISRAPPIILPQLHTLVLKDCIFKDFDFRFSDLVAVAPNLRSLQIGDMRFDDALDTILGSLKVAVDAFWFSSTSLHELLQSFSMISHLQLSTFFPHETSLFLDDELIAFFCPPHSLCPMLIEINFTGKCARFSDAAALAFIKARMAMPIVLRRFRAEFARPMELDIMPELQSFISDGLQVALKYSPPAQKFRAREGWDGSQALL